MSVLFYQGPQDYIKLSIIGGNQLQFQFQVGDTPLGVSVSTSNRLTDNQWHSVSIDRNRYGVQCGFSVSSVVVNYKSMKENTVLKLYHDIRVFLMFIWLTATLKLNICHQLHLRASFSGKVNRFIILGHGNIEPRVHGGRVYMVVTCSWGSCTCFSGGCVCK